MSKKPAASPLCADTSAAETWIATNFPALPPQPPPREPAPSFTLGAVGYLASCADGALSLWLVERGGTCGYDETNSIVVIAVSEDEARAQFPDADARAKTFVTRVGVALPGATAGTVLCRDFIAG